MEGLGQVVTLARHRHITLLHGLQQRRLRAWAGAVDFVRHQKLREHRAVDEAECALAGVFFQNFGTDDIGGHEIRRELDAFPIHAEHDAECLDQFGLCQTRHADQKSMSARQQRHQGLVDHGALAEDHFAHGLAHMAKNRARLLGLRNGGAVVGHGLRIGHEIKSVNRARLPGRGANAYLRIRRAAAIKGLCCTA